MEIVRKRLPGIEQKLLVQAVDHVSALRQRKLVKVPGVSETIDWAESLMALGYREMNKEALIKHLGSVLKSTEDIALVKSRFAIQYEIVEKNRHLQTEA